MKKFIFGLILTDLNHYYLLKSALCTTSFIIPDELVLSKVYVFRGQKVLLDSDLAALYSFETRQLNQAVKRN